MGNLSCAGYDLGVQLGSAEFFASVLVFDNVRQALHFAAAPAKILVDHHYLPPQILVDLSAPTPWNHTRAMNEANQIEFQLREHSGSVANCCALGRQMFLAEGQSVSEWDKSRVMCLGNLRAALNIITHNLGAVHLDTGGLVRAISIADNLTSNWKDVYDIVKPLGVAYHGAIQRSKLP